MRTRVGYAGDIRKENPTYHDLGLHAETLQVDFDPEALGFEDLLDLFWQSHNPTRPMWSPQYRSAVFFGDEEQERVVLESRDRWQQVFGREIKSEIAPLDRFWLAEDYHQKYRLQRHRSLKREYQSVFPDFAAFRESTAVARVNGFLDGYGTQEQLEREIDLLGLTETGKRELAKATRFR